MRSFAFLFLNRLGTSAFPRARLRSSGIARVLVAVVWLLPVLPVSGVLAASVVTTVAPVTALVNAVSQGALEAVQLDLGPSPHGGSLKASQRRLLDEAEVLIMVGRGFEASLSKVVQQIPAETLILAELEGVTLWPLRQVASRADSAHTGKEHEDAHDDDHGVIDTHLWLDPVNAIRAVEAVQGLLSRRYPVWAELFAENAAHTIAGLVALDEELAELFEPVKEVPFVTIHDATQYLERRYNLSGMGAVFRGHFSPSVKAIRNARRLMADAGVACLVREPMMSPNGVAALLEGLSTRTVVINPLKSEISPVGYLHYLRSVSQVLRDCLKPGLG